jgi:protein-tyrosine phosphatase
MEISSYFFKDKCLFGPYPTNKQVRELEELGVKYFIDLTMTSEKLEKYICNVNYISYPIRDNNIPNNPAEYLKFIDYVKCIIEELEYDEKVYIHCKGGHGRSGLVVSSLLCVLEGIKSRDSIKKTTMYHRQRPTLKEKWLNRYCPNTRIQRHFLSYLFM